MYVPMTLEQLREMRRYMPEYRPVALIDDPIDDPNCESTGGGRLVFEQGQPRCYPSGSPIVVPALPYEYWLDADGNFITLIIGTNRDPNELDAAYEKFHTLNARAHRWRRLSDFASEEELLATLNERRAASYERGRKYDEMHMSVKDIQADKSNKLLERLVTTVVNKLAPEELPSRTYAPDDARGEEARSTGFKQAASEEVAEAARRQKRKDATP